MKKWIAGLLIGFSSLYAECDEHLHNLYVLEPYIWTAAYQKDVESTKSMVAKRFEPDFEDFMMSQFMLAYAYYRAQQHDKMTRVFQYMDAAIEYRLMGNIDLTDCFTQLDNH